MSDRSSAPSGRVQERRVTVRDAGPRGMVQVRGDLADPALGRICRDLTGQDMPGRGRAAVVEGRGLLWMAPDEVLLLLPPEEAGPAVRRIGAALGDVHHLAADVSDARAVFVVEGPGVREVLARLTPADLRPRSFGPGQIRRTRLAQSAAAFWMTGDAAFEVICFRSLADYVGALLGNAAAAGPAGVLPEG